MAPRRAAARPARLDRTRPRCRRGDRGQAATDGAVPRHGVRRARRRGRRRITRGRRRAGRAPASALARALRRRRSSTRRCTRSMPPPDSCPRTSCCWSSATGGSCSAVARCASRTGGICDRSSGSRWPASMRRSPELNDQLEAPIDSFFDRLTPERSFWRLGWGVLDTPTGTRPLDGTAGPRPVDPAPDQLFLRVERETLRRFPVTNCVLFTIRTYVTPIPVARRRRRRRRAAWPTRCRRCPTTFVATRTSGGPPRR